MSSSTPGAVRSPPPASGNRAAWRDLVPVLSVVVVMNIVAWALLILAVAPQQLQVGSQVFGIGLGLTAYILGVRHAFDADHIAAIDNTTRKLLAEGGRPASVGFWFALGHSTVVVMLAVLVAAGARAVSTLTEDDSGINQTLGLVSISASGLFLLLIGILNLIALLGIIRVYRRARLGKYDAHELESALNDRGFITRLLRPLMRSISRPIQMYPVGLLFGVGFDTATEVALLVVAATGAASGLPWYAVLVLPLLFTAGLSLFDTLDGAFMTLAYHWAFSNPIRKIYYNMTITGLSVVVALLIGTIELVGVLHARLDLRDPLTSWVAGLDLHNVGFVIVGLFVAVWAVAVAYWKLTAVERRWAEATAPRPDQG